MIGVFMYNGRPIKFIHLRDGVYVYEDPLLKMEEEKDYLVRIKEGKSSKKSYSDHSRNFGTIRLLSDLDDVPKYI